MSATLWFAEQRVNTTTPGGQSTPWVAKLSNGGFVVVWRDSGTGSGDIRAQVFNAAGVKVGSEIAVATSAAAEAVPAVVGLTDGQFRIVWRSGADMVLQDYNPNGTTNGALQTFGSISTNPSLVAAPGGASFGVVQSADDIYTVRHTAAGAFEAANGSVLVNSTTTGTQAHPDVARLSNGNYVVVWHTGSTDVRARLVDSAGVLIGAADFLVNSTGGPTSVSRASVAALPSGGFVVSWADASSPFPGAGIDIRARLFDNAGVPIAADFIVNTTVAGDQYDPEIVTLRDGGFLIFFQTYNGFDFDMKGARFDAQGRPVGNEFFLNTGPVNDAGFPRTLSAALLDDGRVAVVFSASSGLGDADASIRLQIVDPRNGQVDGGTGADTLYGGQFDDQMLGFAGADTLFALSGQDVVYGGPGNDTVFGDVGDDILYGGDDNDLLNAGTGADVVYAELGDDTVFAELGDDLVFGFDGNDTINGGAGDDAVYGQNGDDVMFGDAGADAFFAGFGNDTGFLGIGSDVAFGEEGGDTLVGDDGDDVLDGGAGGDVLSGGIGVDNLIGGGEGDILIGGPGGDRLEGGAGGDLYWWQAQTELNDLVVGFNSAEDQLQFTGSQFGGFTAGSNLLNGTTFISSANPNPTGAVPTFLYNNVDGSLFFDPDGTGGAARVFVALFQGAPALTAGDFQFV